MVNRELYSNIVSSQYNYRRNNAEYYKKQIEKYFYGNYNKVLYMKGEIITRESFLDEYLYFVERGKVILTRIDTYGREYCYGYLLPGEFFGFSSYVNMPEVVNYKALTNCSIYVIEIKAVKDLIDSNSIIKDEVQNLLIDTIRTLTVRQGNLVMGGCRSSFVNFIKEYIKECGRVDQNGHIVVNLDVNLSEIAVILNMTRETLSRIVSDMKHDRIIETKRRYIKILDLSRFIV